MSDERYRLLFDGECPFCRREVDFLKRFDRHGHLALEDISAVGFDPTRYGLKRADVMEVMHGILPDGQVLRRLDAIREAYRAVGLGWLVAPTELPGVRWAFDRMYGIFARNRHQLGNLFGRSCESAKCKIEPVGTRRKSSEGNRFCNCPKT